MKRLGRVLLVVATVLYPFAVLAGLLIWKTSPRVLSLCLVVILAVNFLAYSGAGKKDGFARARFWATAGILTALILLIVATNSAGLVKAYPVLMNLFLLGSFGFTLIRPPSMIFRFATLARKSLLDDPRRPSIESYCRTVTVVWCGFFVFNASAAVITALWTSDFLWTLYNGLISYVLIGILFFGEMGVRAIRSRA
jgi:uncharacterized membrane protein